MIHFLAVAYRPTHLTEARKAATRGRIVSAALDLIAEGGYAAAPVAAVAARAGVAVGTVYRHFPSKSDLFAEVFRVASQREVDAMREAGEARAGAGVDQQIAAGIESFARRALAGKRLAWALLAEPVDPAIETERLHFRESYHEVIADLLRDGIDSGQLPDQDPDLTAAALVGAIAEAMVGPLSPSSKARDPEVLIAALISFCIRATGKESQRVHA